MKRVISHTHADTYEGQATLDLLLMGVEHGVEGREGQDDSAAPCVKLTNVKSRPLTDVACAPWRRLRRW